MNKQLRNIAILVLVIAAIGGLFWFANQFGGGESVESETPKVVCKTENECYWTAHIHATVKIFKDDKQISLNFEQGKLEEGHTHTEKDRLHWHGLIPVDPESREVKDWSALYVKNIPKDLNLNIEGEPKFVVNGNEVSPDYIWKDGDTLEIKY